jgi:HSP20 family molecular chaperone IbpA
MKHRVSEANKKGLIKIIYEDMPNFAAHDIIVADFINWQPLYDLYIIGENTVVSIEIAGVNISNFSVHVTRRYMIIDGIRKSASWVDRNCCTFHNFEIPHGRFNRRIEFPVPIVPRQCTYDLDNGILTLKFPIEKEHIIPIEDEE